MGSASVKGSKKGVRTTGIAVDDQITKAFEGTNPDYAYPITPIASGPSFSSLTNYISGLSTSVQSFPYPMVAFSVSH